jgi:excisionase family DNA binding protein
MKPYSPETLADRWGCSAEKIRRMFHDGELAGFRLGKLIRIPAAEVDRYECQITDSSDIEGSSPSHTTTMSEDAFGSRLVRMTGGLPRLGLVKSGGLEPRRSANE